MARFLDIFSDETKRGYKIQTSDYLKSGKYPIIDQGQELIAGYTNLEEGIFVDVPAIIFGDHTRIMKYVDSPFFLGADGVKILKAKIDNIDYKYLFYSLQNVKIPNTGYNRHFKWLKESEIPLPPIDEQCKIATVLDKVSDLIAKRRLQLDKLDLLVKSQFIEMFGDINIDCKYPTIELGKICDSISGGTPSSKHSEYYGGDIPFVTTPILGGNYINPSSVQTYITEQGVENSATHKIPPYSLMFGNRVGVGKSSINTSMMCTNQDIISFTNIDTDKYNLLYLKKVLDQYQEYFDSQKRGATIKGITSALVKQSRIPLAPITVQQEYVEFVQQADKSKFEINKSLEKLETLKKALMQKYFG